MHPECQEAMEREQAENAEREARDTAAVVEAVTHLRAAARGDDPPVQDVIDQLAAMEKDSAHLLLRVFRQWVDSLAGIGIDRDFPSRSEEQLTQALVERFGLNPASLPDRLWDRFCRLVAARDIMEGAIHEVNIKGRLPFVLEPAEQYVWVFSGAEYLEDQVVRDEGPSYRGISMRVVPGLYVRTGQATPSETSQGFVTVDDGVLAFTDRAILFKGSHRAFRVKYRELAAIDRYDFGFAACKDGQSARMFAFHLAGEPLAGFPYGILSELVRRHTSSN